MKKFRFRLESALRLRELQVDAERAKLHELLSQRNRWSRALAASDKDRWAASQALQNDTGSTSADDHRTLAAYLIGLQSQRQTISQALERAEKSIAEQQKRLLAVRLKERTLTRLREKQLGQWQRELDAEFERVAQELCRFPDTHSENDEASLDH